VDSIPDITEFFFSVYLIVPAALGPGIYSASNRNEYRKQKKFLGSTAQPERKVDNITAVYEPIVLSLDASQPYRPPLSATGVALP
jgi:hypothetical protein